MKIYNGILERVGNGSWVKGMNKISVVKIGDKLLSNVSIEDRIYSFLDTDKDMTLYVHKLMFFKNAIIGVSHKNGDKICMSAGTLIKYFLNITSFWFLFGIALWVGLSFALGSVTCESGGNIQLLDQCMNKIMTISALISGGLYVFFMLNLLKDYILVRGLTLLGK